MTADGLPRDRDVWRIAAPMILSNISVPMLGMVDTGVVGHLESAVYLGAVAIGGTIFSFLYTGVNFLRMGTTGIAAQRYGADDFDGLRISLGQALVVAQIIAVAVILLQWPVGQVAMKLLGAEGALREHALEYFSIRIWSAPGTLANFVMIGWFLGLQNARVPLIIFLTINLTNIALDLLFVLVLGMKVDGVALASVFAEYTGLAVALYFAARELRKHSGHWPMDKFVNLRAYAAFFSVNANLFVRTMALMFTIAFVTAQGTRMGGLILAANAILMQLQNLTAFGLDGLAHAAEALVGKAVGQRRRDVLERSVKLCLKC
jgi:MATE family multidrug resistance protein